LPHLEKILKQGFIYSGKYLPDNEIRLGGWEKLPYVYCNIYFDDIKNLPYSFGYGLIISADIIKDQGMILNKTWSVHPTSDSIYIKPHDIDYNQKIKLVKEQVSRLSDLLPAMMNHEVLIKDKIDLHKYLRTLVLPGLENPYGNIQEILNDNGYHNIKIFSNLPDAKDIY
jgi:hypothetical protein